MKNKVLPLAMSALLLNSYDAKAANVGLEPDEVLITICVNKTPNDSISAIEKTVRKVIAKHLRLEESEIKRTSDLVKDLGADSLDIVEIVMGLENEYGFEFSDEELEGLRKVGDIVAVIEKRKK